MLPPAGRPPGKNAEVDAGAEAALAQLREELRGGLEDVRETVSSMSEALCAEMRRQQQALQDVLTAVDGGEPHIGGGKKGRHRLNGSASQPLSPKPAPASVLLLPPGPAGSSDGTASKSSSKLGGVEVHERRESASSREAGEPHSTMIGNSRYASPVKSDSYECRSRFMTDDFGLRASTDAGENASLYRRMQVRARRFLKSPFGWWVDFAVGIAIVLNSCFIGIEIQNEIDGKDSTWLKTAEHVFLVFFLFEFTFRVVANEENYVWSGWFFLEGGLVVFGVITQWIVDPIISAQAGAGTGSLDAVNKLKLLRISRLLRLVRALRLFEFFEALWKLVNGLFVSSKTVISACLLIIMTIYCAACVGVEMTAGSEKLKQDPEAAFIVETRFGSLLRAMLTLLSFTNADSISGFYEPLIVGDPLLAPFFGCVWLFVTVSLMNLVTAVIVDTAISQSKADEEERAASLRKKAKKLVPQIEKLFNILDHAGDGELDVQELNLSRITIPKDLQSIVDEDKLKDLFSMLDLDGSGSVDKEEFVDGIMHLTMQNVPIETTQTLQLLRLNQKCVEKIMWRLDEVARAVYSDKCDPPPHILFQAEAFQQSEASPSESPAACKEVGGAYMQRLASESLKDCGELEHFAVQPLVDEALKITCTDGLVEALQELEPQRNDATEYTVRAKQKLMDVALTDTVILQELEEFCGSPPESVAVERLFSVGQLVPWKASGSWGAALALSAAVGLLAAAVAAVAVVRLRRQLQATGCVGCASEVERGLTAVAE